MMGRKKLPTRATTYFQARILKEVVDRFQAFMDSVIGSRQDHIQCALLGYLALSNEQHRRLEAAFVRLQQGGEYETPDLSGGVLSPDEQELIDAYRAAPPRAQRLALVNLQDQPQQADGTADISRSRGRRP